jgi:hypothetical protein
MGESVRKRDRDARQSLSKLNLVGTRYHIIFSWACQEAWLGVNGLNYMKTRKTENKEEPTIPGSRDEGMLILNGILETTRIPVKEAHWKWWE